MYKYFINYFVPNGVNYISGYTREKVEVNPTNPIDINYRRIDDELIFVQEDITININRNSLINVMPYIGIDLKPYLTIVLNNKEIFKGECKIQESLICDCDLDITVNSTSLEIDFFENYDQDINAIDDRLVDINNTLNYTPTKTIENLIRVDELFLALAKRINNSIESFESVFLNGATNYVYGGVNLFNNLYLCEITNFDNYDTLTEPATYEDISFKSLYNYLKTTFGLFIFFEDTKIRLEHYTYFYNQNIHFKHILENTCTKIEDVPRNINLYLTGSDNNNSKYFGYKDIKLLKSDPECDPNDILGNFIVYDYSNVNGGSKSVENKDFMNAKEDALISNWVFVFSQSGNVNFSPPTYDNYLFHSLQSNFFAIGRERYDPFFTFKSWRSFKNPNANIESINTISDNIVCLNNKSFNKNYFLFNDMNSGKNRYRIKSYSINLKNKNLKYTASIV